ncbi:hypothetical protein GGH13_009530, partial [Coemansia sp. S155-1]
MVKPDLHGRTYTEQDLNYDLPAATSNELTLEPTVEIGQVDVVPCDPDAKVAIDIASGEPVVAPGASLPVIDGKESVEFQIGIHVVDLFDILASRAGESRSTSRRYQLVHNNPLIRHMRDATNNMLRSSPSSTTIASDASVETAPLAELSPATANTSSPMQEKGNADVSLTEVLDGLQYVVDYRLKGRQQPHLDSGLMRRLCDALLLTMALAQGSFLNKRLTEDARSSYFLFGQFIEEVDEFQHCVGLTPIEDLRRALKLHKR